MWIFELLQSSWGLSELCGMCLQFMPALKQVAPVLQKRVKWAPPGPAEVVNGGDPCRSIHAFFCPKVR